MALTLDRQPLGQLLIGRGLIQPAQLDRALDEQRRSNHQKLLGEILVELRQCSEEQVAEVLAESYGIPFVRVSPRVADPKVIPLVPRAFLEKHHALPLFLVEGTLTVALAEPADLFLREEIERISGHPVQVVAAVARDILATLQTYLPDDGVFVIDDVAQEVDPAAFTLLDADAEALVPARKISPQDAPVEKLANYCLYHAVRQGATDICIEPVAGAVRIRYRIDGRLVERMRPQLAMHLPLVSRLKQLAGLDPTRVQAPQEGVIRARIDRGAVELQVSTAPAHGGETVTVRIDREEKGVLRLEKLGFGYDMLKRFRRLISKKNGLVLIAGPAGSGRNTALYAILRELNSADLNVCSVEDQIMVPLEGVRQLRVNNDAGLDHAAAVHAMLQQWPDVLAISSMPDADTAQLAVSAANNGQLVFACVNAPDATSGAARLMHMVPESYAVGSALVGVLSQRLARRLCPGCREGYSSTHSDRKQMEKWGGQPLETLYRAKGCVQCHSIGYAGRIGLHELLVVDDFLTDRISQGVNLPELRELAAGAGLQSLRLDGMDKMKAGLTSLEEVYRATS